MTDIESKNYLAIILYGIVSIAAVIIGYDFLGFMQSITLTVFTVTVGAVCGFRAMTLAKRIPIKVILGIPVGLNSMVLLYFVGSTVVYFTE